ncbi:PQQ-like beta-propeller repeat protein [Amaricoccus sp.]|uniref:PQQ-like beta-propeller repeat protein n=1 Tax=Amaricoccus sp. TaxID=1872485 RepID=UPI001B53A7BC|nr:PQQ-like beta-propeller repeat protein [Amaricoccus sp.]MBP7240452.1 PQQ-binding-like beta-propeller repeat protein [Amaricoccus sp.]
MTNGTAARRALVLLALAAALAGCQGRDQPLPGERIAVRPDATPIVAEAARPLALPAPVVNADWSHRNGAARGRFVHLAFAANPREVWSVDLGEGDARRRRLITAPIVAGGLVFAMDAAAQLSAFTTAGELVWRRSVVAEGQRADSGPGGGMAVEGGVLYVTTGFGQVLALDPRTGGERWRVTLDAPIRAAPAVSDGRVFVVARNDSAYALSAADGSILWRVQGAGGPGILGGATPAVDGELVVIPFASGEVLGVLARSGLQVWGTAVTGGRRELVRNRISDITGDPVIDGGAIYASNQSGRSISLDRLTGERNWTISEGSWGPAWPVGGSVFLLSDEGALARIDAATGGAVWLTQLPLYYNAKRKEAIVHFGPVLAGGRLWVASSDGLLRAFSPNDGAQVGSVDLPGGAAAAPAIARGVMYVVTRDGRLRAFQ